MNSEEKRQLWLPLIRCTCEFPQRFPQAAVPPPHLQAGLLQVPENEGLTEISSVYSAVIVIMKNGFIKWRAAREAVAPEGKRAH